MDDIDEMPNIEQIKKHIKKIKDLTDRQIVLLQKMITRYRRKSLIEDYLEIFKVSFRNISRMWFLVCRSNL